MKALISLGWKQCRGRQLAAKQLLLCCLLGLGSGACWADTRLTGYIKSFAVVQDEIDGLAASTGRIYQSQNSARFMVESFRERTVLQLHYELSPVFLSRTLPVQQATFAAAGGSYRLTDLKQPLLGQASDKHLTYHNLDRLNVQWRFDRGDLTLGRQAISFGSARVINPTDIFLPFDVRTFNTEYRNGVDALRFQRQWGELGEVDLGLVLGEQAKRGSSAAFLQVRGNVKGKDLHFAFIEYAKQRLVGAGMEASIGNAGFWLEAAAVEGDESYARLSTGLDYALTPKVFGQVEYHYNGAGSQQPDDYLALLASLPYRQGGIFLLGKHYLMPALSFQASPLWSLGSQAIVNLDDSSAFISITAEYNAAENIYLDLGYYWFTGAGLSDQPASRLQSEYGANPNTFYTSLRWYF